MSLRVDFPVQDSDHPTNNDVELDFIVSSGDSVEIEEIDEAEAKTIKTDEMVNTNEHMKADEIVKTDDFIKQEKIKADPFKMTDNADPVILAPMFSKESDTSSSEEDEDDCEDNTHLLSEPEVKFTLLQRIGQEIIKLEGSGTPPYIFKSILPKIPTPYIGMLEAASFPVNGLIGDGLVALTTKEDPLSGLRATGDGSVVAGLLKEGTSNIVAIGFVTLAGYGTQVLIQAHAPDLMLSENKALQILGTILSEEAYRGPIMGLVGYGSAKGIRAIGMKMWDSCIPSKPEKIIEDPKLRLTQVAGQYLLRLFGDLTATETILYYLNVAKQQAIASDPRVQIAIFLSMDVAHLLGQHFSFVPYPLNSLVPEDGRTHVDEVLEDVHVVVPPSNCQIAAWAARRTFAQLVIVGTAYGLSEITCAMAEGLNSNVCTENTLGNRLLRFSAALGIPLILDSTARYVAPKVISGFSNCWTSLFSSNHRRTETYQLLSEENECDTSLRRRSRSL